jgi:ATP-dependent Clp protease ATP-binding subunit ClpA
MFERYSQAARGVIFSAVFMAGRAGALEIGTDHLLSGLLRADKVLARRFLGSPWAAEDVWKRIAQNKPARERTPGKIPLSTASKRALLHAVEEADLTSDGQIGTQHLFLGLLRDVESQATKILHGYGVHIDGVRSALALVPHDDSVREKFVRVKVSRPADVEELQRRIKSIRQHLEEAIHKHDFETAKTYSDEEGKERDKLFLLYQEYGLLDWIFDD